MAEGMIDLDSGLIYYDRDDDRDECKTRARKTLAIIRAAVPVRHDEMFPNYSDAKALCQKMIASLETWPDTAFTERALVSFKAGDARGGMQRSRELVHHYVPKECN